MGVYIYIYICLYYLGIYTCPHVITYQLGLVPLDVCGRPMIRQAEYKMSRACEQFLDPASETPVQPLFSAPASECIPEKS